MCPEQDLHAVLASQSRRRLLELLRAEVEPRSAVDLVDPTGLHVSTIRFHLVVLERAGLAVSWSQARSTVGRPRRVYTAVGRSPVRPLPGPAAGYALLCRLLAPRLGATPAVRARRAELAGRDWATALSPGSPVISGSRPEAVEVGRRRSAAARSIAAMFAEIGFDPEVAVERDVTELRLRSCPFITVAREHPEVVCSLHLGLLRGTLQAIDAPPTTANLTPFVTPDLCVATLTPAAEANDGP